jgi:hypothetical protein
LGRLHHECFSGSRRQVLFLLQQLSELLREFLAFARQTGARLACSEDLLGSRFEFGSRGPGFWLREQVIMPNLEFHFLVASLFFCLWNNAILHQPVLVTEVKLFAGQLAADIPQQ